MTADALDNANEPPAELAKSAVEHGHDGAEALRGGRGRVLAVAAVLLLALAALKIGKRARRA